MPDVEEQTETKQADASAAPADAPLTDDAEALGADTKGGEG
jgi:hypothetical protein